MTRSRPAASRPNSAAERGRGWRVQSTPVVACAARDSPARASSSGRGLVPRVRNGISSTRAPTPATSRSSAAASSPWRRSLVVSGTSRPRPRISRKTTPIRGRPFAGRGCRRRSVQRLERQVADREDVPRAELREARRAGRVPGRHQRDAPEVVRDRVDDVRAEQVADADAEQRHRPAQSERDADPRQPVQGGYRAVCLLPDEIAATQRDEIRAQRCPEQLRDW